MPYIGRMDLARNDIHQALLRLQEALLEAIQDNSWQAPLNLSKLSEAMDEAYEITTTSGVDYE